MWMLKHDAGDGQEPTLSFALALTTCINADCIAAWWMWSNKLTECIIILVNNHTCQAVVALEIVFKGCLIKVKPNRDSFSIYGLVHIENLQLFTLHNAL